MGLICALIVSKVRTERFHFGHHLRRNARRLVMVDFLYAARTDGANARQERRRRRLSRGALGRVIEDNHLRYIVDRRRLSTGYGTIGSATGSANC